MPESRESEASYEIVDAAVTPLVEEHGPLPPEKIEIDATDKEEKRFNKEHPASNGLPYAIHSKSTVMRDTNKAQGYVYPEMWRDDPAPRAVSEAWFDVVCPRRERRYINTRDVRPAVNQVPGIEEGDVRPRTVRRPTRPHALGLFLAVPHFPPLRSSPIISATVDRTVRRPTRPHALGLFLAVPHFPPLRSSPIISATVDRNTYLLIPRGPRPPHPAPRNPFKRMLALHLRRGDYEGHCRGMTYIKLVFYSWNLFPHLPDRFVSEPDVPGKEERFLTRCWPDVAGVIKKAWRRAATTLRMPRAATGCTATQRWT
ncbi:hypothetical protein B0H13DRAFT_2348970 [Mycena leptocephala]|nr:hypothetical protein B0H13DRAFT_2348970 [Mycena leptocephala]